MAKYPLAITIDFPHMRGGESNVVSFWRGRGVCVSRYENLKGIPDYDSELKKEEIMKEAAVAIK